VTEIIGSSEIGARRYYRENHVIVTHYRDRNYLASARIFPWLPRITDRIGY